MTAIEIATAIGVTLLALIGYGTALLLMAVALLGIVVILFAQAGKASGDDLAAVFGFLFGAFLAALVTLGILKLIG
jgi:hypothetical protein